MLSNNDVLPVPSTRRYRIQSVAAQGANLAARTKGMNIETINVGEENRYGNHDVLVIVNKKRYGLSIFHDWDECKVAEQFSTLFRRVASKRHFRHGLKPKSRRIIMVKGRCG